MYILIVARGYPSERYKMNGIFEFDQAKALAKAGHKVIYAAIDVRSIRHKRQWGFESFKKDGVQIFEKYIPKKLQNEIFNKSEIIPNGIDDFWLKNKGTPKTLSGSKINLLTVGIISKRKNQLTTTRVVKLLQRKGYEIQYTVIGKVKDNKVYRQIKDLSYVQYIPHTSKEKLIDIYRENDIFVMPSKTETFGLVYAEAMSQGLPVIYTRGQGFDGQFEEGEVGYSVDCKDKEEISMKIIDIINNYDVISRNAINLVDRYNWNIICEKYNDIYEDCIL